MTWLKDITAVFSPFIAASPDETGGIDHATDSVNGLESQYVEEKGDIPLAEFLDNFFKDSPWRVSVKKLQGKEWYVWQRVEKGKPVQPMIYLAPVSENEPPFILRRPSSSADLLMISFPEDAFKIRIDDAHTLHSTELFEDGCEFPTYIVVPQELKSFKVTDLGHDTVMWRAREDGEYKEYSYSVGLMDYSGLNGDVIINGFPGILHGVDFRCYPGRSPKPPEDVDPPKDIPVPVPVPVPEEGGSMPPFPYGEEENTCLIYDASGSAARYSIDYYNKEAAKMVERQVSWFVASHADTIEQFYKKYPAEKVDEELKKIRLSFRIYLINENETAQRDAVISLADVVDLEAVQKNVAPFEDYEWHSEEEQLVMQMALMSKPIIKEGAVNAIVGREIRLMLESAAFFVGGDNSERAERAMWSCSKSGIFIYFSDEASDAAVSPPYVKKMSGQLPLNVITEIMPTEDGTERVEVAREGDIPLFISIALDDSPLKEDILSEEFKKSIHEIDTEDEALNIINQPTPSELELFTAIGRTTGLEGEKRKDIYKQLFGIAKDKRYDVHVAKRAIALLALWAIRGDSKAKELLFNALLAAEEMPSIVSQIFLAKSVAEIIDDDFASTLLKKITKDPEGRENYLCLIALSSNESFLTALQFMMDHVWTYRIIENREKANLLIALLVLFGDPAIHYEYPEEMRDDVLTILAGGGWTPERLQEAFETFAGSVLPALASETATAAGRMSEFAIKILQPEWKERKTVVLNPIPRERYFYRLSQEGFERNLGQVVKDAKWEEGWTAFYTYDGSLQFETGLLSSIGSTVVDVDWKFAEARVPEIMKDRDPSRLTVVDYHIHPWHDTSIPIRLSAFPSGADFRNWFGKLCEIRRRYPEARVEFRIVSPRGVTVVKPKENFLEKIDVIAKYGTEGTYYSNDVYKIYAKAVVAYEEYIADYLGTRSDYGRGLGDITGYFDIEFPRVKHE